MKIGNECLVGCSPESAQWERLLRGIYLPCLTHLATLRLTLLHSLTHFALAAMSYRFANYLIPFANANVKAKSKAITLKIIKLSICPTSFKLWLIFPSLLLFESLRITLFCFDVQQ